MVGFVLGAAALLPLGLWFGTAALLAIVVFPLVGVAGGMLVWRWAVEHINDSAPTIRDEFYEDQRVSTEDSDVWVTPLTARGTAPGLAVAPAYEFTRIERSPETIQMSDVTVDMATLETTHQTTNVPAEKVSSVTLDDRTLVVDARTGIWTFDVGDTAE